MRPSADHYLMVVFLLFGGLNLLFSLLAVLREPEDPRFAGDKLIYRS